MRLVFSPALMALGFAWPLLTGLTGAAPLDARALGERLAMRARAVIVREYGLLVTVRTFKS